VFVGGVDPRVGKVDIEQEFERFGPIADVWVARNPPGFAFIVFKYAEDADRAVRRMDGRSPINHRDMRRHSPSMSYERNKSGQEGGHRTRSTSCNKRSNRYKSPQPRSRTMSPSSHRNSSRHSRSRSRHSHKNNGRHSPTPDRRSASEYDRSQSRSPDIERKHSYDGSRSPIDDGHNASADERISFNHDSRSVSRSPSSTHQSNLQSRSGTPSDYGNGSAKRGHSSNSPTGELDMFRSILADSFLSAFT
ncbi:unnamed protein product, partial [Trichobilharzia regenti]